MTAYNPVWQLHIWQQLVGVKGLSVAPVRLSVRPATPIFWKWESRKNF